MNQTVRIYSSVFFLFLVLVFVPSFAQQTLRIAYQKDGNRLGPLENKFLKLEYGKNYRLQIDSVNSAHIRAVITSKAFNLQSNISEPLKVLLPGTGVSTDFELGFVEANTIIESARMAYLFLQTVDSLSKEIYKATKFAPSDSKVKMIVGDKLPIDKEGATVKKTEESIFFVTYLSEKYSIWHDKTLENGEINEEFFKIGSEIQSMKKVIDKQDFLSKATFIEKSMKAKPDVMTSGFKAVKDGVDLQISIIDNYLKDTLYKGEIEFVNYKMWNFDFSTGFIFNRLVDVPYYLGPSKDGKKEVLTEDYSKWDIAIGGMAHLTYKVSGFLSLGPQIGIGVSILDAKPKYVIGGGLLLGRKGKVSLNGGMAFGKVKEISNSAELIDGRNFVSENLTAVPTFDRLDCSWYIGISYNLTKKSY